MAKSDVGRSHANRRRKEGQEALREQLSKQKHLEDVIEKVEKIPNLAAGEEGEFELKKLNAYVGHKMSLIRKYLPDLQNMQIQADVEQKTILIDLSGEGEESEE